ncbi:MAG: hypothetical protein MZU79_00330 [Anaerotruncus sp.]|nr:hypothetical protein [Anaerotruncus sp.]
MSYSRAERLDQNSPRYRVRLKVAIVSSSFSFRITEVEKPMPSAAHFSCRRVW